MSLYERQKEHVEDKGVEKLIAFSHFVPNSNQENANVVNDNIENLPSVDNMQTCRMLIQTLISRYILKMLSRILLYPYSILNLKTIM